MEDQPQGLVDFEHRFATEEACRAYLVRLRWPGGFRCPACAGRKAWSTRRSLFTCAACGRETSATAGTLFDRSHTPLTVWFRAIWWVTSQKTGASALGLQRVLRIGSY